MKKLICLVLVAFAAGFIPSCDNLENKIDGTMWFIQTSNTVGFSDKEKGVLAVILSNNWNNGRIQCVNQNPNPPEDWRKVDYNVKFSYAGEIHFDSATKVTISDVWGTEYASQINGTWDYEHDMEYDTHILRRGSEYIIF